MSDKSGILPNTLVQGLLKELYISKYHNKLCTYINDTFSEILA